MIYFCQLGTDECHLGQGASVEDVPPLNWPVGISWDIFFKVFFPFMFYFTCMGVLPACVSVYHAGFWCLQRSEEGVRFPRTRITKRW